MMYRNQPMIREGWVQTRIKLCFICDFLILGFDTIDEPSRSAFLRRTNVPDLCLAGKFAASIWLELYSNQMIYPT